MEPIQPVSTSSTDDDIHRHQGMGEEASSPFLLLMQDTWEFTCTCLPLTPSYGATADQTRRSEK